MVVHDLPEVTWAGFLIRQHHVVADAGGHVYFAYALDGPQGFQELDLRRVVDRHTRANRGVQAAFVGAAALTVFAWAFEPVHVGGGAADVADDALELGVFHHVPGFGQNGVPAARLHGAALVHGDGAEIALPVASAMSRDRKANGVQSSYGSRFGVVGM